MKRLLFFVAAILVLLVTSCKTAEECPKAYSDNITVEHLK